MTLYIGYLITHTKSLMQYKLSFALVTLGQFLTAFSTFLGVYFMFSRFNTVEGFTYEAMSFS
jgi:ABC-2 type transport system permease protein